MKQYSAFFGRYQPFHDGHKWLIEQRLNEGKNIWIGVRDCPNNESNPFDSTEVVRNITEHYYDLIDEGRVLVTIIPDIESINYGRGVGYDINEHVPPQDISEISATKIRKNM